MRRIALTASFLFTTRKTASSFVVRQTPRFSVIERRAMGEYTTNAEEREIAAGMRSTVGSTDAEGSIAPTVASCALGEGIQKYVLVQASDRYFVRGDPRASYHKDAARPLVEELRELGVAHEVLGGGRIQCDLANKKIEIYGYSYGFPWQGEYRHDLSAAVVKEAYPDFEVTTSNEGY